MSVQQQEQDCVSSADRGGFFIPSDSERERDCAEEEHRDRLGLQHKRLRGALDGLFRAVRRDSEAVRPEHISTLVEIIVRNFTKQEVCVSWALRDPETGRDTEVDGELECPGCRRFIAEPVTAACGHSYCRNCMEQPFLSKCKTCQEELGEKQALRVNVVLCGLLENWFPGEMQRMKRVSEVKELLRSHRLSQAAELATQLIDSDPSNIRLRVCRAEVYRRLQHYHHALEDLDMCVSVAPSVEDFQEARQEVENLLEECSEPSGLIRAQSLRAHVVGGAKGEGLKRVSSAPQLGDKSALLKRKLSRLEAGTEMVETCDSKQKKHGGQTHTHTHSLHTFHLIKVTSVSLSPAACGDDDDDKLLLRVPRDLLDASDFECSLCMR
ncbi:LON peptidase N-terminal domain and RING finger protein 1 [Bagarius yarrelli]|uniref:LON peptidase N-terminal domain and RING finger protein 1 n=1 Tax=Bagarius yarrelli TaxID=175774 RepID=A0A556VWE7_BAGYA|nr:LON peptidase N-terminal domain and RING finger protein 1 [Bagarius yarrelli]